MTEEKNEKMNSIIRWFLIVIFVLCILFIYMLFLFYESEDAWCEKNGYDGSVETAQTSVEEGIVCYKVTDEIDDNGETIIRYFLKVRE